MQSEKAKDDFVSVVFTTYNSLEWLKKVIWGFEQQTHLNFEMVIADDGSTEETRQYIDSIRKDLPFKIKHVWQEDDGFRKCEILNKAILASTSEYLIFTDGDCIPRKDFIETHIRLRQEGSFLSGGYHKLNSELSHAITRDDVIAQNCFNLTWLRNKGMSKSLKDLKFSSKTWVPPLMNSITPTNASWNGHNASGWRKDILAVGGFDERMKYWGQDREFGERLMNAGVKGKQIRYSAVCIHLDHSRSYFNKKDKEYNNKLRKHTVSKKVTRTNYGIPVPSGTEAILTT